ncbi:MAG TPA: site-specific DNA-methyltransferase [Blastocatellia bacterium]|nr:site-specific DNA-methyltransferase [Blastocatellia bacterium]
MKPYWESGGLTIYRADIRDAAPHLPIADMVLADAPYDQTALDWDRWLPGWPTLMSELLCDAGSFWCCGTFRMFWEHQAEFSDWWPAQDVVWEKHNGSGPRTDRFRRVHELAVQFVKLRAKWADVYKSPVYTMDATARTVRRKAQPSHWGDIGESFYESHDGGPRMMRSVIYARSMHRRAINPTQKSIELLGPLIEHSCPEGGLVLDPFMGSGSTLDAARILRRRAIGVEIRESECAQAVERLSQARLI